MNDNNYKRRESDLLEFLKYILSCTYISDLTIEPYNTKAKAVFERLDLTHFSLTQIRDTIEYLYTEI